MDKNKKNRSLLSRRQFFKKTSYAALPILGGLLMSGCEIFQNALLDTVSGGGGYGGGGYSRDSYDDNSYGCGSYCTSTCKSLCTETCQTLCTDTCKTLCTNTCYHTSV